MTVPVGFKRKPVFVLPLKPVRGWGQSVPSTVYVEMTTKQSAEYGVCGSSGRPCKEAYGIVAALKWGAFEVEGGAFWYWCPDCWFRRRRASKKHPFPKLTKKQLATVDQAVTEWGTARAFLSDWEKP